LYVIHAHAYFPYNIEADQEKAHTFQAAIKARFADESGVRIGTIAPQAGGPHPMPQFEVSFTKFHLVDVLPWLMFNRPEEFSILVHPFTARVVGSGVNVVEWCY
jgi:aromatic ring-cleaving dioxygenase